MRILERDISLMTGIAKMSQGQLHYMLTKTLEHKFEKFVSTEDYIIGVGNIPVAVVAHMDTVFATPPQEIYFDSKKNVMWSPDGLGADDRAGVFAILKLIQAGLRPTVIFTTDEEIGGDGAYSLIVDYMDCPIDLKYIIQLDRRGLDDCVFYNCNNPKFVDYVERFGFKENFGSFSDISIICPQWGIAGVNLSVGYNNEHSNIETLHFNNLMLTIERVKKMLEESFNSEAFEYVPMPKTFGNPYSFAFDEQYHCTCEVCGKSYPTYEVVDAMYPGDPATYYYCLDCCNDKVEWCRGCGNPYEKDDDPTYCPVCRVKKKKGNKNK